MSVYDKLSVATPVDQLAAMQVARGIHWSPNIKPQAGREHWKAPPPTLPVPKDRSTMRTFDNMIGVSFGSLHVVGYLGRRHKSKPSNWLVRCLCGDYESRTVRSIKNPLNTKDCCMECAYREQVKRGYGNPFKEETK